MQDLTVSYAGNREDIILSGFFDDDEIGFYVDVGAYDPVEESVTKAFYDKKWHGINIEPQKKYFDKLVQARPRDINLNIGVADKPGRLTLREYPKGTGLSTFSRKMQAAYQDNQNPGVDDFVDHNVAVKTLEAVFAEYKVKKIAFMKVDVEGFEYEVLAGNNWAKYRPEVICIEANHVEKDWRAMLKQSDYMLVFFDGLNEYYVDKHKPNRLKRFSYVEAVVFKEPVVSYRLLPVLEEYDNLKIKVAEQENELSLRNQYIANLERSLSEVATLRRHVRRQLKHAARVVDGKIIASLDRKAPYMASSKVTDKDLLAEAGRIDRSNFKKYNQSKKQSKALLVYLANRKLALDVANKLVRPGR